MNTFYNTDLPPHLRVLKDEIEGIARGYGLDFYETIFEVIDADDLNEIAAYGGFPTRYPHWSFGMQYEELKKGYEYGLSKIYEMVINNDPCYAYLMRSNHTVDQKLVMAHVYGHCLAPETKVETRDGAKRITDVTVGDEVLTHAGRYRPVTAKSERAHKDEIVVMTVAGSNLDTRVTPEHPVMILRPRQCVLAGRSKVSCRSTCALQHKCSGPRPYEGYDRVWMPAGQVRQGDLVAYPRLQLDSANAVAAIEVPFDKVVHRGRHLGTHQIPVNHELASLVGYFIAEGNAQRRGLVGFGFHANETAYHEEVARLCNAVFGVTVGDDYQKRALATTIRSNSLEFAAWLRTEVGVGCADKRIPRFLMEHPDDTLLTHCLRGIFNGDGTFTVSAGRKSGLFPSRQPPHNSRTNCARLARVSV